MRPLQDELIWCDLSESEGAFPYEWIEQCDLAEAKTDKDDVDRACIRLHCGLVKPGVTVTTVSISITRRRVIRLVPQTADMGTFDDDGDFVFDMFVYVPCADIRRLLGRPRRR